MTPIGVYYPFWVIDFLSRFSSWFWDKVCNVLRKLFISNWLFDNCQAWKASNGRFGCWNFPFACVSSFENSGTGIGADSNRCNTSENHRCEGQRGAMRTILQRDWRILAIAEGIRIVGGNAYAWRRFLFIYKASITKAWFSGIGDTLQWEFVILLCQKQIHIGIIEHLKNGIRHRLIQSPFCFERSVQSRKKVCQYIEFAWNMTKSDHNVVFQTTMEDLPYL